MLVNHLIASNLLNQGRVVAIPTETVYGLAARYDKAQAIQAIFKIKNRPLDHPLILHIGNLDWLSLLTTHTPSYVPQLIAAFWPGPLTLVLPKTKMVSPLVTAGQATVAVRMPNHPVCLDLLAELNYPIVAPSANPYCCTSPTKAGHVAKYFSTLPILDGGSCEIGVESTIVLATHEDYFQILRPGSITQKMLEATTQRKCAQGQSNIKTPGNKNKHYSPRLPVIVFTSHRQAQQYIDEKDKHYLFVLLTHFEVGSHTMITISSDPHVYAKTLYALWHEAEENKFDAVIMEKPTEHHTWMAVIDRLKKASSFFEESG